MPLVAQFLKIAREFHFALNGLILWLLLLSLEDVRLVTVSRPEENLALGST